MASVVAVRRLSRVVVLLAVLGGLTACSTAHVDAKGAPADPMAPTGPATTLAPDVGEPGRAVAIGDIASITVPVGAQVGEPTSGANGVTTLLIRFSATDSYPAMQVAWQDKATSSAVEQSWTMESSLSAQPSVSGYTRSPATWPKAQAAVATAWSEDVAQASGGSRAMQGTGLWLQSGSGAVVYAFVAVPASDGAGGDPLKALQSLTLD